MIRLSSLLCLLIFTVAVHTQTEGLQKPLTLNDCVAIALQQNFDILLSNASARSAAAGLTAAFGQYLPGASINANYSRQVTNLRRQISFVGGIPVYGDPLANSYSLSANLSWLVFNGFGREAQYDAAKFNVDAAEADIRSQRMFVAYQVTRAYLNVLRTRQVVETQQEALSVARALYDRVKALYDNGKAPITQLLSQETEVANQETSVVQAENNFETAKVELLVLMGSDPSVPVEIDETSVETNINQTDLHEFRNTIGSEQESVRRAVLSRPDVTAARKRMEAAEASMTVARSGYFPTISASGGYSWSNFELTNFDTQSRTFVGLNIQIPVFDQFRTNRSIEQARLNQQQSNIELKRIEQGIQQNVRRAYLQLAAADKGLEIANKAIKPATTAYDAMQTRFNVGGSTLVELQQANYQLITARINKISAVYAWLDAKAFVEYSTGLFQEQ